MTPISFFWASKGGFFVNEQTLPQVLEHPRLLHGPVPDAWPLCISVLREL